MTIINLYTMEIKRFLFLTFMLVFATCMSVAQGSAGSITVSGTVTDATDEPLIGASVIVKGAQIGAVTDIDGNYTIKNVPGDAVLVFNYVGYSPQEIQVAGKTTINVVLKEDVAVLDEVVVVGYGVQKKRDVSTAISQIKSDDIAGLPSSDFSSLWQEKCLVFR